VTKTVVSRGPETLAMRWSTLGLWVRHVLACVAVVFLTAAWLAIVIVAWAIQRPGVELPVSLRNSQFWAHMGAALFVATMFAIWLIVAIVYPIPLPLVLVSIPAFPFLMVVVVQDPDQSHAVARVSASATTTTSRRRFRWLSSLAHLPPHFGYRVEAEGAHKSLPIDPSQPSRPAQDFPPDDLAVPLQLNAVWERALDT
jgi:hypothetical protein